MPDSPDVLLFRANNALQAHDLRIALETEGIPAQVSGESGGGLPIGAPSAARVWVRKEDEPRAREVLAAWEAAGRRVEEGTPARPGWKCPACGEEAEAGFEVCWNCERPRDGAPEGPLP
jgi:hypothetical protein